MSLSTAPVHAPPRSPGSQSALRLRNQERIMLALRTHGPSTQSELSRHTGLSRATISNITKSMAAQGLLELSPTTSRGRRAVLVRISDNSAVAIGVDFGRRHARVIVMNVAYQVVAEQLVPLPLGHLAGEALATARTVIDSLLQVSNLDSSNVLGVGVGVPGPIDAGRGKVVEGTILPEWEGIDLRSLHRDFEYPVIFDNDANLGALAEHLWGPHRDAEHLMFVKVGSGIGAGLILGGKRYAGSTGITGEIGHTVISDHGKPCQCGKRGCLETVASLSSLIETLSPNAHHPVTVDDIVRRALGADPPTMRAVTTAGVAIGHALGNVINLISPQVIVIGGPLVGLGELLMTPIHAGIAERALGTLVPSTDLSFAALGDHAEAMGAAALVLQGALVS